MTNTYYLLALLCAGIFLIIWLTAFKKLNAFYALSITALLVGLGSGLPPEALIDVLKKGFGGTMQKIGLLIILGTTLGAILEKTAATTSMANGILRLVKERNAPVAISITGFIIGFPIFCDSGFIILSGLNHSLVNKTKYKMTVMAAILGTSLYAVHCLVPPHPGITAAVGTIGGNLGSVMIWGLLISIPPTFVAYQWCIWRGKNIEDSYIVQEVPEEKQVQLPSLGLSFLPVILPIALIAIKSILEITLTKASHENLYFKIISFAGNPIVALAIGIICSMFLIKNHNKHELKNWLSEGLDKAGIILVTIGAGGMFGEVLHATGMGKNIGNLLNGLSLGIFFPFIIASIIKTAQGSSTVAVITASSLVLPLLSSLGLQSEFGITLAALSMGAGSMMLSHANDAYFWVVSRFSNLATDSVVKIYSTATIVMAITSQLLIWLLFLIFI
jgi:GntP family gluconate:H+ symporter